MARLDRGGFCARRVAVAPALPDAICFRVTRYCNARCGFCLAPPDGAHPPGAVLAERIDWLFTRGVHTIHFCGGEPTIHPACHRIDRRHAAGDDRGLDRRGHSRPEEAAKAISARASTYDGSISRRGRFTSSKPTAASSSSTPRSRTTS
jgi:MoaA/NifB/PqqE/SkfB family radical SAM enzyme